MFLVGTTPLDRPYGWQLGRGGRGRAAYAYLWDSAISSALACDFLLQGGLYFSEANGGDV